MKSSAKNIHMESLDDLFGGNKTAPTSKDGVQEIALSELHSFKNHPFKVLDDEKMRETVESIQAHGVLVPAIVRPRSEGGFELIAGHRRKRACELAKIDHLPAIVRDYNDDEATIIMVDTNIQRDDLLPSELAFAFKMKLEAMNRQGKRTDLTCSQVGNKLIGKKSSEILAEQVGKSKNQIFRFIRLTELITPLLDMVDGKKLALNSAVELSYLKKQEQTMLLDVIDREDTSPSLSQAQKLKKYSQDGKLSADVIDAILTEEKGSALKVTLHGAKLRKYFPKSYTPAQMEFIILGLLDKWKKDQGDGPHG